MKRLRIFPFDPVRLADTTERELNALWKLYQAVPLAHCVEPVDWPNLEDAWEKRDFRTEQIIGALLEIGSQFRAAARGSVPFAQCIRDRVSRMANQDSMFALSPSLETVI